MRQQDPPLPPGNRLVDSLLDEMEDGNEYGSIVSLVPRGQNFVPELKRGIAELEAVRKRPCLCYVANVVQELGPDRSIAASDHLPFNEMVERVAAGEQGIDIFLVTPGGSAESVLAFVDAARARFTSVEFLVPYKAMSAGTLWALSGDRIWLDRRGFLGPIDPQVPSKDGRFVPQQALIALLDRIQQEGALALEEKRQPAWANVELLRRMDQRELGAAITASGYVVNIAAQFLKDFKFKDWTTHGSTGAPVTDADRTARAIEVATLLANHERWRAHGHSINREVLARELRIQIDHPETVPGLERAIRRLWALFYYTFDKSPVTKAIISGSYTYIRQSQQMAFQLQRG